MNGGWRGERLVWQEDRLLPPDSPELFEDWSASAERRAQPRAKSPFWTSFPGHVPGESGVWAFIFGDMVVFGWFFCIFMFQRSQNPELFDASHQSLALSHGLINTLLLVTSSWFVAMGVRAMRTGRHHLGPRLFVAAMVCGLGFVVNKYLEYSHLIHLDHGPDANEFFSLFFILTGIHLLHLLVAMGVLTFMCTIARRPAFRESDARALESGASFWHLIDLLWIVLFALFYLVR